MKVLVMFLIACAVWAQKSSLPPIPRYLVKRALSPIVVDGKVDDKAWAAAGKVELIFPWKSQTGPKQSTIARLLWDDDYLYVSYECEDAEITAQFTERDDPVSGDDAVEIFINPKPSQTTAYIGLEMNARAVLYDYLSVGGAGGRNFYKRFNLDGIRLATHVDGTMNVSGDKDRGWSLEVAIPWINFEELSGRPQSGDIWRANLNRWDGLDPNRSLSMWSDPVQGEPNPHVPERFGELLFVQ